MWQVFNREVSFLQKIDEIYAEEIKRFCDERNYNYKKLNELNVGNGKDMAMFVELHKPIADGLLDDRPGNVVLLVEQIDGKCKITETEHTKRVLEKTFDDVKVAERDDKTN